jgi:pyruvate kinase
MRRAKIVCTIGPSSSERSIISQMITAGMDVARLNFSHGDYAEYESIIRIIREESQKIGKPVAILQDLQGIKIRIGEVENNQVSLKEGDNIEIFSGNQPSNSEKLFISYPSLIEDMNIGEDILIDDGLLKIRVIDKLSDRIIGKILEGGILRSKKGVNLPSTKTTIKSFTEKDKNDLIFGIKFGVDYVAISFVRNQDDILVIKKWAEEKKFNLPPLIAKIEKKEAIEDIHSILDVTDGIMVARGDLGVELAIEEVPIYQKKLIELANQKRKIVITATQMLESMREHTRPTRAEATDVANAVLDGTDALMLSAETATGKYPLEAIKTMDSIISFTEKQLSEKIVTFFKVSKYFPEAIASGAVQVAQDIGAKAIVVFSNSGFSAMLISKLRPSMPIIAFTPEEAVYRRLSLLWAVVPKIINKEIGIVDNNFLRETEIEIKKLNLAHDGDAIVFVASSPFMGNKNVIRLHKIGDPLY